MSEQVEKPNKSRQKIKGIVVSDKMNKTRIVEVDRRVRHDLYHKSTIRQNRFFIHDEKNEAKTGDLVLAVATRPLSKNKNFTLVEVLEKRVQ